MYLQILTFIFKHFFIILLQQDFTSPLNILYLAYDYLHLIETNANLFGVLFILYH